MKIPTFDKQIEVQTQSTDKDAYGASLNVWTTAYVCFASVTIQGGALLYEPSEFIANVLYRITTWTDPSFTFQPTMRVVYVDPTTSVTHTLIVKAVFNDPRTVTILAHELNGAA